MRFVDSWTGVLSGKRPWVNGFSSEGILEGTVWKPRAVGIFLLLLSRRGGCDGLGPFGVGLLRWWLGVLWRGPFKDRGVYGFGRGLTGSRGVLVLRRWFRGHGRGASFLFCSLGRSMGFEDFDGLGPRIRKIGRVSTGCDGFSSASDLETKRHPGLFRLALSEVRARNVTDWGPR